MPEVEDTDTWEVADSNPTPEEINDSGYYDEWKPTYAKEHEGEEEKEPSKYQKVKEKVKETGKKAVEKIKEFLSDDDRREYLKTKTKKAKSKKGRKIKVPKISTPKPRKVQGIRIIPRVNTEKSFATFAKPNVALTASGIRGMPVLAPPVQGNLQFTNHYMWDLNSERSKKKQLEKERLERLRIQKAKEYNEYLNQVFMKKQKLNQAISGKGALPQAKFNKVPVKKATPGLRIATPQGIHTAILMRSSKKKVNVGKQYSNMTLALPNFNMNIGKKKKGRK